MKWKTSYRAVVVGRIKQDIVVGVAQEVPVMITITGVYYCYAGDNHETERMSSAKECQKKQTWRHA